MTDQGLADLLTPERLELDVDDPDRPGLVAMSDNGPPMKSHATRDFMALMAIWQHRGRPYTPTDQAWIETMFRHIKGEWPHLETINDPALLERTRLVFGSRAMSAGDVGCSHSSSQ